MSLENELRELLEKKTFIQKQIKEQTESLQKQVKEISNKIKQVKLEIKNDTLNKLQDKSIHVLERFNLWLNVKHEDSPRIINEGAVRDYLYDNAQRYRTYYIVEDLQTFLDEGIVYQWDFDEKANEYDYLGLLSDNGAEVFEKVLNDEQKQIITNVIENAIEMNIDEFKFDW